MGKTWMTKWGPRKVREIPPTLEEAFVAAECLTEDLNQKIEIAASLMGMPVEEVRAQAAKLSGQAQRQPDKRHQDAWRALPEPAAPRRHPTEPVLGRAGHQRNLLLHENHSLSSRSAWQERQQCNEGTALQQGIAPLSNESVGSLIYMITHTLPGFSQKSSPGRDGAAFAASCYNRCMIRTYQ